MAILMSTTPPPLALHGTAPAGAKKDATKTDVKLDIAPTSMDRKITAEELHSSLPQDPPKPVLYKAADGKEVLVELNKQGVEHKRKLPLDHTGKLHEQLANTPKVLPKSTFSQKA